MSVAPGPANDTATTGRVPDAARDPIDTFLDRLRHERAYSVHTLGAYRTDLAELLELMRSGQVEASTPHGPSPQWGSLDEHRVRRWVAKASAQGLAPRSIARRLSAWRGFFDWLLERGVIMTNPVRRVRAPRSPRLLPRALAPDQAVQLVGAPYPEQGSADGFEAARDRAIFELLYSSGLRLSELVSLDVRHFDSTPNRSRSWLELEEAELVVTGKGSRMRRVPVGREAITALGDWLKVRAAFLSATPGADSRALFLGRRGGRIGARMVQSRIGARARQTGIEVPVSPHVLRHSFASHLLQSSGDLRAVQELLGHASIASTQIYTALDFQRLAAVYDAAHPRARRSSETTE